MTVQNSVGVSGFDEVPAHVVAEQIEAVLDDIGADAIKTGMLPTAATITTVADTLSRYPSIPIVVDPVAASKHGDPLLHADPLATLRERLLPMATVLTPNLGEARLLTGHEVTDRAGQDVPAASCTYLERNGSWSRVVRYRAVTPLTCCSMAINSNTSPRHTSTRRACTAAATP